MDSRSFRLLSTASLLVGVAVVATAGAEPARLAKKLSVTSSAFGKGETIPTRFTCDGKNVSPPLRWSGVPDRTKEIALVMDDPDAPGGTFVHWVVFKLPRAQRALAAGKLPQGARQAINDQGNARYGGPCPPLGDSPHRYRFTVYALEAASKLKAGVGHGKARRRVKELAIRQGRLTGRYGR